MRNFQKYTLQEVAQLSDDQFEAFIVRMRLAFFFKLMLGTAMYIGIVNYIFKSAVLPNYIALPVVFIGLGYIYRISKKTPKKIDSLVADLRELKTSSNEMNG